MSLLFWDKGGDGLNACAVDSGHRSLPVLVLQGAEVIPLYSTSLCQLMMVLIQKTCQLGF